MPKSKIEELRKKAKDLIQKAKEQAKELERQAEQMEQQNKLKIGEKAIEFYKGKISDEELKKFIDSVIEL